MCRKSTVLLVFAVLTLCTVVQAATIIWVSDNKGFGDLEPNTPGDIGWVNLLRQQGYTVDYRNEGEFIDGEQYWRTLDPNKIAELDAADLVIMSRNADSGSYSSVSDNEPNEWNAVTTPIISLSAHMSRSNKWGWLDSTGTMYTKDSMLTVVDPNSVIFNGVAIDANNQVDFQDPNYNVDWVKDANTAGNGTILATGPDGLVSIVTWEAGQTYFDGGSAVAGGPRMLFIAGTGSKNSGDNYAPDGMYNLTPDGETIFLNAVQYMLNKNTKIVYVTSIKDQDQNGTQDDVSWDAWLSAQGYTVDFRPGNWSDPPGLDPNKIAELDAADLIIASRGMSTGEFDGQEVAKWNSLTTPIICTNAWMVRSNRWKWMNSSHANKDAGSPLTLVTDSANPIFNGIDVESTGGLLDILDPNVASGNTSFLDTSDVGNGTLLATTFASIYDSVWIAEWHSEVEYYAGAGEIAGGHRLLFMAGTQDDPYTVPDGNTAPVGVFNLNATGQQLFLNAINYMLKGDPYIINGSFEQPGTGKINNWDGGTNGKGTFPDVPGWSSDTMPTDSGVEQGWSATDGTWTAFLKGSDPNVWQLTRHVLGPNDVMVLSVNAQNNWAATTLEMIIYVDDNGTRVPIATQDVELTGSMQTFTLTVNAADVPDAVGKQVGVEFNNVTAEGSSWIGMDEVSLTLQ